jgi:hypothetical protein
MSKIAFECVDAAGKLFSVAMTTDSQEMDEVIAATVQAYRRSGIEVVSATRTEEMVIDVNLYAPAARRDTVSASALQWLAGRGGRLMEKGALMGALALSVLGFDDGFSILSVSKHAAMVASAVEHIFHLV